MHNFYFSIGHLPENGTQTSYSINGPDNLGHQHVYNVDEAFIELLRKF